jgi:hypothetical protein
MVDDNNCGTIDCGEWYEQTGTESVMGTEICWDKLDITSDRCEAADDNSCKDPNSPDCETQSNNNEEYRCEICQYIDDSDCNNAVLGGCSDYHGIADGQCNFDGTCNATLGGCVGDIFWSYDDCTYYCDQGGCAACYCGINDLESGFDDVCDCQLERPDCSQAGNWDGDSVECNCNCNDYDILESVDNDNCWDEKDNDCDGKTDSEDFDCPLNVMNFTGTLSYRQDTNAAQQTAGGILVKVTIKNETLGYEKSGQSKTDNTGKFFVTVHNIKSNMMNAEGFDLSIYVSGEVEAVYTCHYSKSTGRCT